MKRFENCISLEYEIEKIKYSEAKQNLLHWNEQKWNPIYALTVDAASILFTLICQVLCADRSSSINAITLSYRY